MSDPVVSLRPGNFVPVGGIYRCMELTTEYFDRPRRRAVLGLAAGGAVLSLLTGCSGGDDVAGSGTAIGAASAGGSTEAPPDAGSPAGTTTPAPAATPARTPAASPAASTAAAPVPSPAASRAPSPAAVPAGGARPTAVPAAVMLRPTDWPGGRVRETTTRVADLEQTEPSACQARTAYPSDRHRVAARTVSIASDEPESGGVHQVVVRYAPGRATQAMAEMRRVLAGCRSYRPADASPPGTRTHRLEAERFAGDDALLVRQFDRSDGGTREWGYYISVVRLGDSLVTTSSEIGEGVADATVGRRLASVGAARAACLRSTC